MAEVEIWQSQGAGRTMVGSISFDESPQQLHVDRTATGFNLKIPAKIGLRSAPEDEPRQALKNLRLIFSVASSSGPALEVGRLYDEVEHSAYVHRSGDPPSARPRNLDLTWSGMIPALIAIERYREGGQPQLYVDVRAEHGYIIQCEHWHSHAVNERRRFPVFTVRQIVQEAVMITYPTEVWERMAQKLIAASQDDPNLMLLPLAPFLMGRKP